MNHQQIINATLDEVSKQFNFTIQPNIKKSISNAVIRSITPATPPKSSVPAPKNVIINEDSQSVHRES